MKKICEFEFYKGHIIDTVSLVPLTIRGSMPHKSTEKGWAAYTVNDNTSYTFAKILNGVYSVVIFFKGFSPFSSRNLMDSTTIGRISRSTMDVLASSGISYINGIQSTAIKLNKYHNLTISGININTSIIYLLTSNAFTGTAQSYLAYFAIYEGTLSQLEINTIQDKFNSLQQVSRSNVSSLKQMRSQINFDLNIQGNNYVTVDDTPDLNLGTGSFTIQWTDSYPQRQSATFAGIVSKATGSTGFEIIHNGSNTNSLLYGEKGGVSLSMISTITSGNHTFLLQRNALDSKLYLYCDEILVYTSASYTFKDLLANDTIRIKINIASSKSSGNFCDLKIWKGVALTPQQAKLNRKDLVLDLPMNEGQGQICYDYSGKNHNGTIVSTASIVGKEWTKVYEKSNIVIDEKFDNCPVDGTNILPQNWVRGSGSFTCKTTFETTDKSEKIVNGDFSQGTGNVFTGWTLELSGGSSIIEDLTGGLASSRCVKLTTDGIASGVSITQSAAVANRQYKVEFWARGTGGQWYTALSLDAGGIQQYFIPPAQFTKYTFYFTSTTSGRFQISRNTNAFNQSLWIDNVSITEYSESQRSLGILSKSQKYLQCTTAGTLVIPSKQAYGQFKGIIYKASDANVIDIVYIANNTLDATGIGQNGYLLRFGSDEKMYLYKTTNGVLSALITSSGTYSLATDYEYTIVRSIIGQTWMYINNVLIGTITDNTFTTNNFRVQSLGVGDRLGKYEVKIKN